MSSSKILLCLCLCFVAGIFFTSFYSSPRWLIAEFLLLGVFYGLVFQRRKAFLIFGACLIVLGLGCWRGNATPALVASRNAVVQPAVVRWNEAALIKASKLISEQAPQPQSGILAGILLGDQSRVSFAWKQKMNITGVRHITAVSGMNIILLANILVWLGILFGLYRQPANLAAVGLIWLYILLIGLPASAVRAGIMGTLLLLAGAIGRQNVAERTIILAATVMLAINPSLLIYDWGFQLSFLATMGLIYLAPFFRAWLGKVKVLRIGDFSEVLAMTLAAQVFTWPILVYNFGSFSLVAVLANLLIAPMVLPLMIFGFIFVLGALIWPAIAWVLSWPCQLLLNYLVETIDFFSRWPGVYSRFSISPIFLAISYLGLGFLVWRWRERERSKFLIGF